MPAPSPFPFSWCFIALLLTIITGCAVTSSSDGQVSCREPRVVYAVKQGWHVGLVLEAADITSELPSLTGFLAGETYVDIGWGDRRYYPAEDPGLSMTLLALFVPTESVLHIAAFSSHPEIYFAGQSIIRLQVESTGYQQLLGFVADSFTRSSQGKLIAIGPGLYGRSRFYLARGAFHAFHNCNTWMARALGEAGVPVSSFTLTASSLIHQLRGYPPDFCFPADQAQ